MFNRRRRDLLLSTAAYSATYVTSVNADSLVPSPAAAATRRVVTGHDAGGHSIFVSDNAAPRVIQRKPEGITITDIWETRSTPADNTCQGDPTDHPLSLAPPANGTVLRIMEFAPGAGQAGATQQQAAVDDGSGIETALKKGASAKAPGFHTTNTADYVIVISGEIVALMDEGEKLLKAGDVLIQRGTHHAWSNRSKAVARLAFVLIDAHPLPPA
jgi:quercetin dioxygenase-like cupin family protein